MTLSRWIVGRAKQFGESSIFINADRHVDYRRGEKFLHAWGDSSERLIAEC